MSMSDRERAKNKRRENMKTGTRRSSDGGGGSGGRTNGKMRIDAARKARRTADVGLKKQTM